MEVLGSVATDLKPEHLNGVYKDIAEHLGIEIAQMIFQHYKGLQVTFPTRFLASAHLRDQICSEYTGHNISGLARKYQYSERWIRKILAEGGITKNYPDKRIKQAKTRVDRLESEGQ